MIAKIAGIVIIASSLIFVFLYESSSAATGAFRVLHWPAMALTGIGPIGLLLLCSDWQRIKTTVSVLMENSPRRLRRRHEQELDLLQGLSQTYYGQGASVFETFDKSALSPYVQRTIERLAIRMPILDVRQMLEREQDRVEGNFERSLHLLNLGVRLAPSIGMLGTILGMVQLLSHLKDPSHIGSNMSLALLTTFYGLFFSLVFWTPLQQLLEAIAAEELNGYDRALHWLELLEKRKPAQYFSGAYEVEVSQ